MISRPTYDDANLILRLYEMRRDDRMREARAWFTAHFRPKKWEELAVLAPPGSGENASYRMVISYWDMVASFVATGVLNQELFFQSGRELLLVYERMRPVLSGVREAYKDPSYMANLERVGLEFAAHMRAQSPDAYEAFVKRIAG
ncbi:MAG TPA: hypothetical protein VMW48_00595 [Vicinamibacterales bacterium]|nr:hypothetical protein [Vicinamibacterales bacterium]